MDDGLDPTQKEAIQGYLDRPDVMVLVKLRCNSTGQIVTVGNIHVHWGQMKLPDVQCIQVSGTLSTIVIVKKLICLSIIQRLFRFDAEKLNYMGGGGVETWDCVCSSSIFT